MRDKVLNDLIGAIDNIHVAPVHPRVIRLESRSKQIVTSAAHGFAAWTLSLKRVARLDALVQFEAKVLLDNHGAAEGDMIRTALDALELGGQHSQSIIGAVADQESQVDQVVRVGQLGDQLEVLVEVGSGILERGKDQHALLALQRLGGRLDVVEVDVDDGRRVNLDRGVRIEDDGRVQVGGPSFLLSESHLCRGFRRAPADESEGFRNQPMSFGLIRRGRGPYLCISGADELMPCHSNTIMAAMAMRRRKRALVRTTNIALPGGRRALAAFQLTPPFGSSMMKVEEEE